MRIKKNFTDFAKYYDLIYSWKDFKKESIVLDSLIKKHKKTKGKELLEVACGSGKYIEFLKSKYKITGLDLSSRMLKIAKKNFPNVKYKKADMINFNMKKEFDVILCLFASISYVKTYSKLSKTLKNFSKHLKPGGVVIIDPWFTKSQYKVGAPQMAVYKGKDIKIARLHVSKIKGNVSILDLHFSVAEKNKDVKNFREKHELGMFEKKKFLQIMREAGFKPKFTEETEFIKAFGKTGLYVGIKK